MHWYLPVNGRGYRNGAIHARGFVRAMLQWYRASYNVHHGPVLCTTNLADNPLDGAQYNVVSLDVCVCISQVCLFIGTVMTEQFEVLLGDLARGFSLMTAMERHPVTLCMKS